MMKDIFKAISGLAAAMIIAASSVSIHAQDYISTPVSISKEKVRINGKVCYSHIVLEKQTLFSIAKAYEVSIEDIYRFNPDLKQTGLKKNSILIIPSKETPASEAPKDTRKEKIKEEVKKEELKKEADGRTETEVKDVKKKSGAEKNAERKPKKQKVHIRKWYEDLDVIAERYGVTAEDIMKANGLKGRKLENRQKLIIPDAGDIASHTGTEIDSSIEPADTAAVQDSIPTMTQQEEPEWTFMPKDRIKATLILPFKASGDNVSRNNMDFYSGFLLGVRKVSENGTDIELNVYDSADNNHPIAVEDLSGSDLIVGPVSAGDLGRLLERIPDIGTVISPLDPRAESLAKLHDNFIQVPVPASEQFRDLVKWIEEDSTPEDKVLMITEKGAKYNESVNLLTQIADSSSLSFIPFSYSILEGRDVIAPLTSLMTETGTNRVLVASESEAFVNDVVRNLNILNHRKMNIVLYAPAKIRSFETIEVENLHNTSLHISLGYNIDYDAPQVQEFLLDYRALFNTEPSQYAYQGYDIAAFFLDICGRYGTNWSRKLPVTRTDMLQSTFDFLSVPEGGYMNNGVRRVVYGKDWSVKNVR